MNIRPIAAEHKINKKMKSGEEIPMIQLVPIGYLFGSTSTNFRIRMKGENTIIVSSKQEADKVARFFGGKVLWYKSRIIDAVTKPVKAGKRERIDSLAYDPQPSVSHFAKKSASEREHIDSLATDQKPLDELKPNSLVTEI